MTKQSFSDAMHDFTRVYNHLTISEYMKSDIELEIPALIAKKDEHFFLRDLIGRPVDVGDMIALGHPKYVDLRVGIVVGFTAKSVRVCIFKESEYRDSIGLGYSTFINGTFMIIQKKSYKEVD